MVAHALEEYGYVEAHPVKSDIETVLHAWQGVSDNLAVARVIYGILAVRKDIDTIWTLLLVVEVHVTKVAGKEAALHTVVTDKSKGIKHIGLVILGLFICLEQSVHYESPDFADALSRIVVIEEFVLVVVISCDMGNIVTHGCPQAVIERLAGKLERISPADGKFITLGSQVG